MRRTADEPVPTAVAAQDATQQVGTRFRPVAALWAGQQLAQPVGVLGRDDRRPDRVGRDLPEQGSVAVHVVGDRAVLAPARDARRDEHVPQRLTRPWVTARRQDAAVGEVASEGVQRLPGEHPNGALADDRRFGLAHRDEIGLVAERARRAVDLPSRGSLQSLTDQPLGDVLGLAGIVRGEDPGDAPPGRGVQVERRRTHVLESEAMLLGQLDQVLVLAGAAGEPARGVGEHDLETVGAGVGEQAPVLRPGLAGAGTGAGVVVGLHPDDGPATPVCQLAAVRLLPGCQPRSPRGPRRSGRRRHAAFARRQASGGAGERVPPCLLAGRRHPVP